MGIKDRPIAYIQGYAREVKLTRITSGPPPRHPSLMWDNEQNTWVPKPPPEVEKPGAYIDLVEVSGKTKTVRARVRCGKRSGSYKEFFAPPKRFFIPSFRTSLRTSNCEYWSDKFLIPHKFHDIRKWPEDEFLNSYPVVAIRANLLNGQGHIQRVVNSHLLDQEQCGWNVICKSQQDAEELIVYLKMAI